MHSCIYQIMRKKNEERIDESNFYDHLDEIPADYVSDMDEDDEEDYIKALPNILPNTMFKCEGREITFLGGDKNFIDDWKESIMEQVDECDTDSIVKGGSTWQYLYHLEKAVNNVLDVDCRFWFNEDGYVIKPTEFIMDCLHMEPGTKLYVGAVIDYHY